MSRISRWTQKIFALGAANNGQFGSAQVGTKILSNDLSVLQTLSAFNSGWLSAVLGSSKFPPLEEFQALSYIETTQLAYLFQEGIPAYDAGTTYYTNSIVKEAGTYNIYGSVTNANIGNPLSDPTNWTLLINLASAAAGIPASVHTGANYAPVAADSSKIIRRSNSGTAMSDTFPGTSGALAAALFGYIENIDASAQLAVGVGSGGSISVGSSYTANSFFIAPGETWFWISLGSGSYIASRIAASALHTKPPQGSFKKLFGSRPSTTTATFTADAVVAYDAAGNSRILQSFSQTLNTATSGIGGLTSAIAASTWYAVYAAFNPTTGAQGIFGDISFTAPSLPSGYTYSALIGAARSDGSSLLINFNQYGRNWSYFGSAPPTMASGNVGGGGTNIAIGAFVPTAIASRIRGIIGASATGASQGILASAGSGNYQYTGTATAVSSDQTLFDMQIESTNMSWISDNAAAFVKCSGFEMNL